MSKDRLFAIAARIFLPFAIFIAATGILAHKRLQVSYHGDESGWMQSGLYYSELLFRGDFAWSDWSTEELAGWGWLNPHLGKLAVGLPMEAMGYRSGDVKHYKFAQSPEENAAQGLIPSRSTLMDGRIASCFFGGLCCLLIFWAGREFDCALTGTIAAILLMFNPLFDLCASRAMTDVHYNLMFIGQLIAGIWMLKAASRRGWLWANAGLGVAAGLGTSVKITGIVIGGGFWCVLALLRRLRGETFKTLVAGGAVCLFVAFFLIYALNPLCWPDVTMIRPGKVVEEIGRLVKGGAHPIENGEASTGDKAAAFRERFPQLFNLGHVFVFPYLFKAWQSNLDNVATANDKAKSKATQQVNLGGIVVDDADSWQGSRIVAIFRGLLIDYETFPGESVFLLAGILFAALALRASALSGDALLLAPPLAFFAINFGFILLMMNLNWDRYYLPSVIAAKPLIAYGMVRCGRLLAGARAKQPAPLESR